MKHSLAVLTLGFSIILASMPACTTLENRRDMYSPETINGPYTRMLRDGIPRPKTVSVTTTTLSSADGKSVVR